MEIVLKPSWILTTDHSASSYGQPVLVNRGTGEAFGPGDVLEAYPSWGWLPARDAVKRMLKTVELSEDQKGFVEKFFNP